MTVREMMERLSREDPNAIVVVDDKCRSFARIAYGVYSGHLEHPSCWFYPDSVEIAAEDRATMTKAVQIG